MKSPVAKRLLKIFVVAFASIVAVTLVSVVLSSVGNCTGGPAFMAPTPMPDRPVICDGIPNSLGAFSLNWIIFVMGATLLSPIWLTICILLVVLPEISERQRLKRQKD